MVSTVEDELFRHMTYELSLLGLWDVSYLLLHVEEAGHGSTRVALGVTQTE